MTTFTKLDEGKPMVSLITNEFNEAINNAELIPKDDWDTMIECLYNEITSFQAFGAKYILAKNTLGLILNHYQKHEIRAALTRVLTFGANKYEANNWRKCDNTQRYLDAAYRHLLAIQHGELEDAETDAPHLDHLLCNIMFLHTLGYQDDYQY